MSSIIKSMVRRLLSLSAGEADGGGAPDTSKIPLGKVGDTKPGKPMVSTDTDGEDEDTDDDQGGSAPGDAGKTSDDGEESDEDDDTDDGDGGESDGEDTNPDGDGADDEDDDGVDPAVALSLRRNWESRFDASANEKDPDPLAMVKSSKFAASDDLKARVRKAFEEERDLDAIVEIVTEAIPHYLKSYDDSRINPTLTEAQINARNARVVSSIREFDEKNPGARTPAITKRMADLYEAIKEKYGYKKADQIPVEDWFYMAGGRLKKQPKSGGTKTKAAPTKVDQEEERKAAALAAAKGPERIGKKSAPGKGRKPSEADDVAAFVTGVKSTRADPFIIR